MAAVINAVEAITRSIVCRLEETAFSIGLQLLPNWDSDAIVRRPAPAAIEKAFVEQKLAQATNK